MGVGDCRVQKLTLQHRCHLHPQVNICHVRKAASRSVLQHMYRCKYNSLEILFGREQGQRVAMGTGVGRRD